MGSAMFKKIISGGQTGVDRAALDFAMTRGVPVGGWCPKGRKSDDGPIDTHYPLQETPTANYRQRTYWNMRDCDGALILHRGHLSGGTLLTVQLAISLKKPHCVINLNRNVCLNNIREWAKKYQVGILNVAGPRESGNLGIQVETRMFLQMLYSGEAVWMPMDRLLPLQPCYFMEAPS
ncbi:MAG: putative molybdenum carrier protein [Magnetococcales bacterium]|nr:putative molybdenum carrier protein [Magnetococcales bacterium]